MAKPSPVLCNTCGREIDGGYRCRAHFVADLAAAREEVIILRAKFAKTERERDREYRQFCRECGRTADAEAAVRVLVEAFTGGPTVRNLTGAEGEAVDLARLLWVPGNTEAFARAHDLWWEHHGASEEVRRQARQLREIGYAVEKRADEQDTSTRDSALGALAQTRAALDVATEALEHLAHDLPLHMGNLSQIHDLLAERTEERLAEHCDEIAAALSSPPVAAAALRRERERAVIEAARTWALARADESDGAGPREVDAVAGLVAAVEALRKEGANG